MTSTRSERLLVPRAVLAAAVLAAAPAWAGAPAKDAAAAPASAGVADAGRKDAPARPDAPPGDPNRLVRDGVAIEFTIEKLGEKGVLREGDFAEVRFKMTDQASGRPVPGLKPAVWLDMAGVVGGRKGEQRECKDKVALYLQGSVGIRPMIDLNSYYLLMLNQDASISVVDPVVSMTGNTSLFATVVLKRPGADWAKTADERRLYVSMPKAGEVSVVDAEQFKVLESVPAGKDPTRVRLQGDGRYLWVGNDAADAKESGVTVIDTEALKPAAFIPTGRGHHEIALSAKDRRAFVSNRNDGTVSVIDVATLKKVKDLRTGPLPIAVASSSLSQAVYVADGKAGTISVIDPERLEVTARIRATPGLGPMRFSMDGRWGFAVNPAARAVYVVDAAENKLVHEIAVDGQPYQISFTRAFAYVRLLDSEAVKMVNLLGVGKGKKPAVQSFGAGTGAPRLAGDLSLADSISAASTDAAVFIANPGDNNTYFYMEGMNAPMGSYGGYGHAVRAAAVVDKTMKEVEPGVFASKVRIPVAGRYDVAFLLDNPRVLHCFGAEAAVNPDLKKDFGILTVKFEPAGPARAGETVPLKLRLTDPTTNEPKTGIGDVKVLYHRIPGGPKEIAAATEIGGGVYQATLLVPMAGTYYAFVTVPSLEVKPKDLPFQSIVVRDAPAAAKKASR